MGMLDPMRFISLAPALLLIAACGDPDCPEGTEYRDKLCRPVDAGMDGGADVDGGGAPDDAGGSPDAAAPACEVTTDCPDRDHATSDCVEGSCVIDCDTDWGDCDDDPTTGCEVSLADDPAHCASCDTACDAVSNAIATCTAGECGYECDDPWGDCDGDATNGCEERVDTATHCATCGHSCTDGEFCSFGSCVVPDIQESIIVGNLDFADVTERTSSSFVAGGTAVTDYVVRSTTYTVRGASDGVAIRMDDLGSGDLEVLPPNVLAGTGVETSVAVAADGLGGYYVAGTFDTDLDVGPLDSEGEQDVFLASLRADGGTRWVAHVATGVVDRVADVTVDGDGNVFVVGAFVDPLTIEGTLLEPLGVRTAFIAKYDSLGDLIWAKRLPIHPDADGYAASAAEDGSLYLTGVAEAAIDFGGGELDGAGDPDVVLVKLDESGDFAWAGRFGNVGLDTGVDVAATSTGVVLLALTSAAVDFGGGALAGDTTEMVMVAFGADGTHAWSERFEASGGCAFGCVQPTAIGVDGADNVYAAGAFNDDLDLGGAALSAPAGGQAFIGSWTAAGVHRWSVAFGGDTGVQVAEGISVLPSGLVAVAGQFRGGITKETGGSVSGDGGFLLVIRQT